MEDQIAAYVRQIKQKKLAMKAKFKENWEYKGRLREELKTNAALQSKASMSTAEPDKMLSKHAGGESIAVIDKTEFTLTKSSDQKSNFSLMDAATNSVQRNGANENFSRHASNIINSYSSDVHNQSVNNLSKNSSRIHLLYKG